MNAPTQDALDRLDRTVPWRLELWSQASAVTAGGELINRGDLLAELDWHDHMAVMHELTGWLARFRRNGTKVAETRVYDKSGQRAVWDDGTSPDA